MASGSPSPPPVAPGPPDPFADETLERCPGCTSAEIGFLIWGKSLYHPTWSSYFECRDCGLVFVNPRRSASVHDRRVEYEINSQEHFAAKTIFDLPEVRRHVIKPVCQLLPPRGRDGRRLRWLDVGCAIGNLLIEAERAGYEPHGLELNRSMVDWAAANRPGLNIRQGRLQDLPPGDTYDVISADNVLEHIHSPDLFLRDVRRHIHEESLVIVRVPNLNNFARPWLQLSGRLSTSFILDPDAHPCNYSRRSLVALFGRCGLRTERVMEHLMISYPLKHILNDRTQGRTETVRRLVGKLFLATFLFDWIVPRGGIDITIVARQADQHPL